MTKKLCPTHHLYYTGERCPLCESERIESYASKFGKYGNNTVDDKQQKAEKERDINEEDLERLINKYGAKKKIKNESE